VTLSFSAGDAPPAVCRQSNSEAELMDLVVLALIGSAVALLFLLGICVSAREKEHTTRKQYKGDAYRLRDDSTRHTLDQRR